MEAILITHIDIVFDGPPGLVAGRFVEVEDVFGKSIRFGTWVHRPDGYWVLRIAMGCGGGRVMNEALPDMEKLAAWMLANSFATGHGDTMEDLLGELDWQVKELRGRVPTLSVDAMIASNRGKIQTRAAEIDHMAWAHPQNVRLQKRRKESYAQARNEFILSVKDTI